MLNEENENRRWTTMDDGAFRFGTFTQRVKGWLRVSRFLSASMVVYLRFNCRFQVYGVIDSGAGGSSNRGRFEAKWPSGSRRSAKPMWQTLLGVAFVSGTFAGGTRGSPSQAYAKSDDEFRHPGQPLLWQRRRFFEAASPKWLQALRRLSLLHDLRLRGAQGTP